jgi:hypothetical protein
VVLQPGESRDLRVTFRPTAACAYQETVPLHVNGLYSVNVLISGAIGLLWAVHAGIASDWIGLPLAGGLGALAWAAES